ncbi:MAG: glycogen-binding domain-containing protein [Proteobacteria bacterium]|nr:glycogen-binding domain-containing protein [Pseudomonadota bacterium]MBU1059750.1 glycogen-binding domain-containing protein [Pseudomonadota bacterium]
MNNFLSRVTHVFLVLLILCSMGCGKKYFVQVNDDSLSFFYPDTKAKDVSFAFSADHFRPHPATKGPENVWQVTVPLNNEFSYFYIVDGEVTLPDCPNTVLDDFGTKNCFYVLTM